MNIEQLALNLPVILKWIDDVILDSTSKARSIDSFGFRRLGQYYAPDLLRVAKVVPVSKVPIPPLSSLGLPGFADFERMDAHGITYGDVYFVRADRRSDEALHFHELVHVLQWRLLGKQRFLMFYALGHLTRGGYDVNPFEVMAYQLQAAFEAAGRPFDVSATVAKELTALSTKFTAALGQSGRVALGTQ